MLTLTDPSWFSRFLGQETNSLMFILHQSLSTSVGARTIKLKKLIKQAIRGAEISEPALPNQEDFRPARESFEGNS